ncbi:MAG: T9SS type A sorting domain-containing protein [Bacteroidia bacterium]|nr:T9SS type A sorting domain-containing protein [Bacteroidia bacterium]
MQKFTRNNLLLLLILLLAFSAQGQSWGNIFTVYDKGNSLMVYDSVSLVASGSNGMHAVNSVPYYTGGIWDKDTTLLTFDGTNWQDISETQVGLQEPRGELLPEGQEGFWIGSNDGVNLWDGSAFIRYDQNDHPAISGRVYTLFKDGSGNKWFGLLGGILKFDGTNWTYYNSSNTGLNLNGLYVYNGHSAANGNLYFGTTAGLIKFDGTNWTLFNTSNSPIQGNDVRSTVSIGNTIYVAIYGTGLSKFDGTNWSVYTAANSGLPTNLIYELASDGVSKVWGTLSNNGFFEFNGASWTHYKSSNSPLPNNNIRGVTYVGSNTLLFGSATIGAGSFDGSTWTIWNSGNSGLDHGVTRLCQTPSGSRYFIDHNNYIISKYNGTNWRKWSSRTTSFFTRNVRSLVFDNQNHIWVATPTGLGEFDGSGWTIHRPDTAAQLSKNLNYSHCAVDPSGNIWLSSDTGGIYKWNGTTWTNYNTQNSGLFSNMTGPLAFAPNGDLWFATAGAFKSLGHFDGTNWVFYNHQNSGLDSITIQDISVDPSGTVWVGHRFPGTISGFDGTNWTTITSGNSQLPAFYTLNCIANDPNGDLWIGTNKGIFHWLGGANFDQYNTTNSNLPNLKVMDLCFDLNGPMWSGTSKGAAVLDAESVWPGDANSDLIANNVDVIAVGIATGSTGPVRPNASTNWQAQPCPDWAANFTSGPNYKHADCDGNGLVGVADLAVITLNYGQTHFKTHHVNGGPNDPLLWFENLPDSLMAGDTLDLVISLGTDTLLADSVYGIAFTLNFDTSLVKAPVAYWDYSNSWMGNVSSNLIHLEQPFYPQGEIDFGISRNDQTEKSGYGEICRVGLVMQDDIAGKKALLAKQLSLQLYDITLMRLNETVIPVNTNPDSVVVWQNENGFVNPLDPKSGLEVFPNPANGRVNLRMEGGKIFSCTLFDPMGRTLAQHNLQKQSQGTLDLGKYPGGVYFLRVETSKGGFTQRLIIQPN